ncbi:ABC transporter permease [Bdellovibrionota bacterium FG-1]
MMMTTRFSESAWAIRCVWLRYFDVFRKGLAYGLITTFVEPILYLLSFGFGMGSLVGKLHLHGLELSYRQFILAGIVAQTVLFQSFFEAAYGGFVRMYYQKVFQAIATTPITLSEVLWGELLWDASKSTFAASVVLFLGCMIGDFKSQGAVLALPICFVCSLLFSALGLWVAAASRTIDQISYPQYLFVFPMFLFCGVFFPIENLPSVVQGVAWILPLTSVSSLVRCLTLGFPFQWWSLPILLAWLVFLVPSARRAMTRRLVK